jgi:antitoxin (DNA-binding transcriptional repressor) of toxin-antitoxin stability system
MISVNMHEEKTRLSQLVLAALAGEDVVLCSNGQPRVRLAPIPTTPPRRDLIKPDPALRAILAPGYDPAEPLSENEWPSESP